MRTLGMYLKDEADGPCAGTRLSADQMERHCATYNVSLIYKDERGNGEGEHSSDRPTLAHMWFNPSLAQTGTKLCQSKIELSEDNLERDHDPRSRSLARHEHLEARSSVHGSRT